jgi:hypothetical protein
MQPRFPNLRKYGGALALAALAALAARYGISLPPAPVADQVAPAAPAPVEPVRHQVAKLTAEDVAPTITGRTTAAPYTLVRLRAANLPKGAAALWSIFPRKGADVATTPASVLEFTAPPGVYEVELTVISTGEAGLSARRVYETVTVGDGKAPPVTPPVTPPPAPPGAGKLDPVAALGRVQFGNASCTATVIGPRRADGRWDVLTASHCMNGVGASGTLNTKDGRKLAVRVVVHQKRPDLAWLVTVDPVDALAFANVAAELPVVGTKMFHQGYGIDVPGNRENGTVTVPENADGQTQFRLSVSPGDSGGGMLRADTLEVIGTVCCTSRLAGTGDVWGASSKSIRAARPGAVNLDQLPEPAEDVAPCSAFGEVLRRLFSR